MFANRPTPTLLAGLLALATGCAQSSATPDQPDGAASVDAAAAADGAPAPDASADTDANASDAASADAANPGDATSAADAMPDATVTDAAAEPDAGVLAFAHTIAIDGANDFVIAEERLATSTAVTYYAYVSWDADYVYLAMSGADVASNSATRWMTVYLGGANGTTAGVQYNNQQPTLPFNARYHVRWKADNSFTGALQWNGAAWVDAAWDFVGDVFQTGTFIELRIPRVDLGSPTELDLHVSMINEANGGEWTYAGAPATSFTDGYDQDHARYYRFDLSAPTAPAFYAPLP